LLKRSAAAGTILPSDFAAAFKGIAKDVPETDWVSVHSHLAKNLDRYIYGRPEDTLMDRVFADTGYWITLLSPRDELHDKASAISREYSFNQIVPTKMVLTEFLNGFSDYGPHLRQAAPKAETVLRVSGRYLPADEPAFRKSFETRSRYG
jgi:hypothetical protein